MSETTINSADRDRSFFTLIGVTLTAWAILVVWSLSPYSNLLDHHNIGDEGLAPVTRLWLFLCGWFLMVVAMMFPRSFLFKNRTYLHILKQPGLKHLSPAYLSGYFAAWMAFGSLLYLGDAALHEGVERFAIIDALSPGIFWALLLIVGGYQFSSIKRTCLYMDHVPNSEKTETYIGRRENFPTVGMGIKHGLYCLGSCWGLMLLMFAAGSMNLLVMLGFTGIMVAEKAMHARWQISRLVGVCFIILVGMKVIQIL